VSVLSARVAGGIGVTAPPTDTELSHLRRLEGTDVRLSPDAGVSPDGSPARPTPHRSGTRG
jgi:hypothetical protein